MVGQLVAHRRQLAGRFGIHLCADGSSVEAHSEEPFHAAAGQRRSRFLAQSLHSLTQSLHSLAGTLRFGRRSLLQLMMCSLFFLCCRPCPFTNFPVVVKHLQPIQVSLPNFPHQPIVSHILNYAYKCPFCHLQDCLVPPFSRVLWLNECKYTHTQTQARRKIKKERI